jgi:galactitol-specific phosphotransferase system IIB component
MRRTISVLAAPLLVLASCGGGSSSSSTSGDASNSDAASSGIDADFCQTVQDLTGSIGDTFDESVSYTEIADAYRSLAAVAPGDLTQDLNRLIDGFEKIEEWTADPNADYPFTDSEDAEFEASMGRIEAAATECGIDVGSADDTSPGLESDSAPDETSTADENTMTIDNGEESVEVAVAGDLPADFPFALPDVYEVGTTAQFEDASGTMFTAVLHAPVEDFDMIVAFYEDFLSSKGFEMSKNVMSSGPDQIVMLNGQRDDASADIWMSTEEIANDDNGNLVYETNVSLTWSPQG